MHARPGIPLARAAEIAGYLGLLEGALPSPVAAPWRCRLEGQCGGHRMAGYRPALTCSTVLLAAWLHDIVAAQSPPTSPNLHALPRQGTSGG